MTQLEQIVAQKTKCMFFTGGFETPGVLLVNDNSGPPISGDVNSKASITIDLDYDCAHYL